MWEVNVYKALLYFQASKWKGIYHSDFRARLAHTLMTLGKVEYPSDVPSDQRGAASSRMPGFVSPPNTTTCPPPVPIEQEGCSHVWVYDRSLCKRCSYCGTNCHSFCKTCEDAGIGRFYACSSLKRSCTLNHAQGAPVKHYSFSKKRKGTGSSSNMSSESGGDTDHGIPHESPNSVSRRQARGAAGAARAPRTASSAEGSSSSTN